MVEPGCLPPGTAANRTPVTSVLAALLVHHDRLDELRQRAAAGDHIAGMQLVQALIRHDREPEAAEVLQRVVDAGYWPAASSLERR